MSGNQTSHRTWQSALLARFPALFNQEINGRIIAQGYPSVDDGWRDLVETAIGRVANAVATAPVGSLHIRQIKEKFATIRIYWSGDRGLTDAMNAAVDEAIELAEARSACTCEICGAPGRQFKFGGWVKTVCGEHGRKGVPAHEIPGPENIHVTIRSMDGKPVVRARRYVRATDSFEEIDPYTLTLKAEED
jgi:hypothetical protein